MSKISDGPNHGLELNRLAVIMKEEKWSNKKLAAKIGYDPTTISLWVNNHVQPPITTMARIALMMDRNLQEYYQDTKRFDKAKKDKYLKILAEIARQSKRVGKDKVQKARPTKTKK